jgi:hypothetical protein
VTPDEVTHGEEFIAYVITGAAELLDGPTNRSEDYQRGVIELATRITACGDDFDDAVTLVEYAIRGVKAGAK